jgi:membrane-bound serine protease (ClpP class)
LRGEAIGVPLKVHMTALGVVLVLIGVIAVAIEAHRPTHGALGGAGAVALAGGGALALAGAGGGLAASLALALVLVLCAAAVVAVTVRKGVAVRRRAVRSGPEAMIGRIGEVRSWGPHGGKVAIDGGLWRAQLDALGGEATEPPCPGQEVVIEYVSGLMLTVRPAEEWELVRR